MLHVEFLTIIVKRRYIPQVVCFFDQFQKKTEIKVTPSFVDWNTIWRELINIGIYHRGADVAEVGTSWLKSLAAMNTLRPFSSAEIARLGGEAAFIPATWSGLSFGDNEQIVGIPIRSDVRIILYWKDMLEEVGVNPDTAFNNHQNTHETLEKLKSIIDTPFGIAISPDDPNITQTLATWVWAFGGDLVTPNCDKVLLMEQETLAALRAYFSLFPYVRRGKIGFSKRHVAATITGPWGLLEIPEEDRARLGIAIPPGPPFVGGTVLSIFQHTSRNHRVDEALKLIEFLIQPQVQAEFAPYLGLLPTRLEAWEMSPIADIPYNKVLLQALSIGRGLPAAPLWGMIEEKLKTSLSMVWEDLLTNPDTNVDLAIEKNLEPTVTRLNLSLK